MYLNAFIDTSIDKNYEIKENAMNFVDTVMVVYLTSQNH